MSIEGGERAIYLEGNIAGYRTVFRRHSFGGGLKRTGKHEYAIAGPSKVLASLKAQCLFMMVGLKSFAVVLGNTGSNMEMICMACEARLYSTSTALRLWSHV